MSQSFMYKLANRLLLCPYNCSDDWVLDFTFNDNRYASGKAIRRDCPQGAYLTTEIEEAGIGFMWGWKNLDTDSIDLWFRLKGLY